MSKTKMSNLKMSYPKNVLPQKNVLPKKCLTGIMSKLNVSSLKMSEQ